MENKKTESSEHGENSSITLARFVQSVENMIYRTKREVITEYDRVLRNIDAGCGFKKILIVALFLIIVRASSMQTFLI